METLKSAPQAGCELYHAVWKLVGANFFDAKRLADWGSWEHRFDDQIADEETALSCIDQMLASLNDPFTERVVSPPVSKSEAATEADKPADQPPPVMSVLRPDGIGFLQILTFDSDSIFQEIEAALLKIADCQALVINLRTNNGGRMHRAIQACCLFIANGLITTEEMAHEGGGVEQRRYYVNEEQFFRTTVAPDGSETTEFYERPAPIMAGKPTVILVHRITASAAEMFACAIVQNATPGEMLTIGSDTAGKGIGQSYFKVADGRVQIKISCCRWLAPGGDWVGDCRQTVYNPLEPDIKLEADRGPEGVKAAFAELKKMLGRTSETAGVSTSETAGDSTSK